MQTVQNPQHLDPFAAVMCLLTLGGMLASGDVLRSAEPEVTTVVSRLPAKVQRYVDHLMQVRDLDGDGRLAAAEWQPMSGEPAQMDLNADNVVSRDEMLLHVTQYGLARMPVRLIAPGQEDLSEPVVTPTDSASADGMDAEETTPQVESGLTPLPM